MDFASAKIRKCALTKSSPTIISSLLFLHILRERVIHDEGFHSARSTRLLGGVSRSMSWVTPVIDKTKSRHAGKLQPRRQRHLTLVKIIGDNCGFRLAGITYLQSFPWEWSVRLSMEISSRIDIIPARSDSVLVCRVSEYYFSPAL
jgi:hypothetical protein